MAASSLSEKPIDVAAAIAAVGGADHGAEHAADHGAVVVFLGSVRDHFRGRAVAAITYEAYRPMAEQVLARLVAEEELAHPGLRANLVHRFGRLLPGEVSVAICVSSPHRDLAYTSSRHLLERLKREAPIWKHEHYCDGESLWREDEALS